MGLKKFPFNGNTPCTPLPTSSSSPALVAPPSNIQFEEPPICCELLLGSTRMSSSADKSVDYEDEVFDDFEDTKAVKPAPARSEAVAALADDELISAAHLAKQTNGAGGNTGSDDELEPVHIQLTVNILGSAPVALKFDDSISYEEFKKRLAGTGCDTVTYKNLSGKDITIDSERQLDYFIDMMVDDFEGENKLKGSCNCTGNRVSATPVVETLPKLVPAKSSHVDSNSVVNKSAPQVDNTSSSDKPVADAHSSPHTAVSVTGHVPSSFDEVPLSNAEGIHAYGQFRPIASVSSHSTTTGAAISAVREGTMRFAWQHLPQLRLELASLDNQRAGILSASQVSVAFTRVLNLQASNADLQALISHFSGDNGIVNIEQLLLALSLLNSGAQTALESVRSPQIQSGPSVGELRIFNCHALGCGYTSTSMRCAVLDLCLDYSKGTSVPSAPASSLLSKYSSTSHKINLSAFSSICAEVGALTDIATMSVNSFCVTRNLALATQYEVGVIAQTLMQQEGRRAVLAVSDPLLASLRSTIPIEKRKSINPFASSKPLPRPKADKAVIDAITSGCSGNSVAMIYLNSCAASDNISLISFVEGLHCVDSTGMFSAATCSALGKALLAILDACIEIDSQKSGVILLSEFLSIISKLQVDSGVISDCTSASDGNQIDFRHLLTQRLLVLNAEESAVISSWTSASQQSLRSFLVSHSQSLNVQFVTAASKTNCVPRKIVKSCISKLPDIGNRSSEQNLTALLDGCSGNSTSDPDAFFLDTMSIASVRLLQIASLQEAIFLSRPAIIASAISSGIQTDSFPLDLACKIVASAIPARHSFHDISSFLCQFSCSTGCIQLYRAIQSIVRLPNDSYEELSSSFHGPFCHVIHQLCAIYSLHGSASASTAIKPIEDVTSAPGIQVAKSLYKAFPSLTFGHGALSMFLARISKGGSSQISVKGFLQQFTPAVAILTPAILVLKGFQPGFSVPSKSTAGSLSSVTITESPQSQTKIQNEHQAGGQSKLSKTSASSHDSAKSCTKPGLDRARANFRKLIRVNRPSSLDVLRMLGVSTSLFPSALFTHESTGKSSLTSLLKTNGSSSSILQLSGMWPVLRNILPCNVLDLRIIEAKSVPSAGASYASVNRKVRVSFFNGSDGFIGSLSSVSAKTNRGDDHTWQFPSAQILSAAVSKSTMDAYPNGGLLIELSIIVTKTVVNGSTSAPASSSSARRDMSAGWALIPWAELKAGTKTLPLIGGVPWAQQKIHPEDCGSKRGFFGLSKMQAPVSTVTVSLVAAGEAPHFPDKCVCSKSAVPLLQLYSLFLRSQISGFFGQSTAVRPPVFHNVLLSAFPQLISEPPLRRALVSKWSELGGNSKMNLASFADPQNRDVLEQVKILHKAVSLLQPLLHMQGLHWGVSAFQEDEETTSKKERIVQAFAVNPIECLSGKEISNQNGTIESLKFDPIRTKELCFTIQLQ